MHLGTLSGKGLLEIPGSDSTSVVYKIDVYKSGGLKEARGVLLGDDRVFLNGLKCCEHLTLHLENGGSEKILITECRIGTRSADIAVSGPLPGY